MTKSKPKKQLVHLRVDRSIYDALVQAARARGSTLAEYVRDAAVATLAMCPTCGQGHAGGTRHRQSRTQSQAAA